MVIQRWQSIMLLISGVMMGIFSFSSLGQIQAELYSFNITALGIFREGIPTSPDEVTGIHTVVLFIVSILSCILPLIGIFCFRNLPLQKKVCLISALLSAASGVILAVYSSNFASSYEVSPSWSVFICAPLIAVIGCLIAWRLIGNDQKKLWAADRLR